MANPPPMEDVKQNPEETEYHDPEDLERLRQDAQRRREAEARDQLKARHWMHCPTCGQDLVTESSEGLRAAVCKSCQGVWLDAEAVEALVSSRDQAAGLAQLQRAARAVPGGAAEA